MKKILTLSVFILAFALSTTTYAESGKGKEGLLGIFRSEDSRRDKNEDSKNHDEGLEIETEHGVTFTKEHGKDGERTKVGAQASIEVRRDRAIVDIDRRVASLTKLEARIDAMNRISDATKKSLSTTIDAQIKVLNDLKAKIAMTTDEATLKAHIESITKAYRVYMLVMPQATILSAADRITTTADLMTTFGTKLETRIAQADSAGKDVSALESLYADMKVQIAEAKANASTAITLSANLKPDNGDKAVMESNKKAMTEAHAKLKSAQDDLKSARKDAEGIIKGLKSFNIKVEGKIKAETDDR